MIRVKPKFFVGSAVIVAALAGLMIMGVRSTSVYYLRIDELAARGEGAYNQDVRLAGELDKASVQRSADPMTGNPVLRFNLVDRNELLPVVYAGIIPDTFGKGESVVVEGRYTRAGVFEAKTVFVQCPSKYEAELQAGQ